MNYEMSTAIYELLNTIKTDYYRFISRNDTKELTEVNKRMIDEFNADLGYKVGRKYIKITQRNEGAVWGFVVLDDDNKFKVGDILRPASWSTPARNKARGNILEGNYSNVSWTGPNYL